ncbi:MAG: glycosyltransferase [Acidobacteria bacterium]|nr:glycosyltransferase [Acidobacteriota bacterium]
MILACFDQTRELELTLHSFLHQDFPRDRYELIVVDDASPDHGARQVVSRARQEFPDARVHYLRQHREDSGEYFSSAAVKNLGSRLARGRYVWFNNAEIVQAGESLSYVLRQHEESAGPLCLRGRVLDLPFEALDGRTQAELDRLHEATDHGRERVATADHAGLASMRRDILLAIGGIDERFDHWGKEDLDLAARLKRVGVTYRYDDEVKSFHISHPPNHVKGPDYQRMCRLLEENNSRGVVEVHRGQLWGELRQRPAHELEGTVVVTTDGDLDDLESRLEALLYGAGADAFEVLVASLDTHRVDVEERLQDRFLAVPYIALAGEEPAADARRVRGRIRTQRAGAWPEHGPDPRARLKPLATLDAELVDWIEHLTRTPEPAGPLL